MRNIIAVLAALILALSGCGRDAAENGASSGGLNIKAERLVKEFAGTVNIVHRNGDSLLLSTEEGELYKYYDINVSSAEVKDSRLTEMSGLYIYQEPVGDKGFIVVEELEYKNTLKFISREGDETVIAEDIGPAEAINVSIAPKAGKLAYTSPLEGNDTYGLYIYDMTDFKSQKLMSIKGSGIVEGFNYLVNWSPDEHYVIIQDKYIYDTGSGIQKGELKSAYSQWSPSGSRIAFVLEDGEEDWLPTTDYHVYPGKKVCVYDISKGSYDEVFRIDGDEYIFGGIAWGGNDSLISFSGVKVKDKNQPDWYMKLNYSSLYIVDLERNKSKRLETNVDASDGTMIELANLKFTGEGKLLSFTVGNYESSTLHIVNTETLDAKSFENAEYLHWMDGENYIIPAGSNAMYFVKDNSIIKIDESLQENVIYTSRAKLDDFYLSEDGTGIMIFELQDNMHTARYLGEEKNVE